MGVGKRKSQGGFGRCHVTEDQADLARKQILYKWMSNFFLNFYSWWRVDDEVRRPCLRK